MAANQRTESVSLPKRRGSATPTSGIQGLPMVSARGFAQAASQSSGSAELFSAAADVFGRVADTVGKVADAAALREGSDAGAIAGLDREFRPRGDLTIYGQAYDQAAIETFKSKMSVDLLAQMDKAAADNVANPEGLAKAMASIKAGWQEKVDDERLAPHIKPEFEAQFARSQIGLMRQATREFHANVKANQLAALETEREARSRAIEQQAYRLGLDPTADEVLAGEFTDLRKRLGVRGPDGQPIVAPAQQVEVLRSAELGVAKARINGAFSRLDTLTEKAAFIQKLEADYQAGGDRVLDLFDPAEYQAMIATLSSQARQLELGSEQSKREVKRAVKAVAEAAKSGVTLPDEEMSAIKARVAASNDPEIIQDFGDAVDTLGIVRHLNMTPPAAIEAAVDQERARLLREGTTVDSRDLARLQVAEDYLKNAHTELANDPLGFAAKTGTATVAPISITDPVSLGQRAATAEHVAAVYGREPKYFRPEEKEALAAASRKGGNELLGVATAITAGMGENAPAALEEISKDAPALAMVGGLWLAAGGKSPPAVASDMAKGVELRSKKGFVPLSQTKDVKAAAADVLQGVLARQPTDQAAVINATNAVYDARAYQQGVASFDSELYQQSLREVLGEREVDGVKFGGIATQGFWGNHPVVLPPSVKQNSLDDVLEMIDAGDLDRSGHARPVGQTNAPIAVSAIRDGTLVQVGTGRYAVAMGDPETPGQERWLKVNAAGDPFVLDLGVLAPVLARRRPDLFTGVR